MEKKDLKLIREGAAELFVHSTDKDSIPSKSMQVFYNKKMEINRDISCLAVTAYNKLFNQESLNIVDSMAASGISSIRMLKECKNIKRIYINDLNPVAIDLILKNLSLNNLDDSPIEIEVSRKDATLLFSELAQKSYTKLKKEELKPNIISIDPFGTPNLYVDSAFKAIQKIKGMICITATDTPVLFGLRPKACIRKYMSKPLHTEYCKEIGARILIYFISRMANVNKIGIAPLLTFYSGHFIRIFALTFKNQKYISTLFKFYGYIVHCNNCGYRNTYQDNILKIPSECPICDKKDKLDYAGPLWIEKIHNKSFLKMIINSNENINYSNKKKISKILQFAIDEIDMPASYYDIHKLSQKLKLQSVPKMDIVLNKIRQMGYKASRTHFEFTSIKTNMKIDVIKKILLETQI